MNPAAPVTSSLTARSLGAALHALQKLLRLVALRLELFGSLEVRDRLGAAAVPIEGVAEVVVRVGLVRIGWARARELPHGPLQQRNRAREVALLDQLVALVGQCVAARA